MGWNKIKFNHENKLLLISKILNFINTHSIVKYFTPNILHLPVDMALIFVSFQLNNLYAVQFHLKSHKYGIKLLNNFVKINRKKYFCKHNY